MGVASSPKRQGHVTSEASKTWRLPSVKYDFRRRFSPFNIASTTLKLFWQHLYSIKIIFLWKLDINAVMFTHESGFPSRRREYLQIVLQNGGHWENPSKVKVGDALTCIVHGHYFIIWQANTMYIILSMLAFYVCNLYNDIFHGYYTYDVFVKRNALKTPVLPARGGAG